MINWTPVLITLIICLSIVVLFVLGKVFEHGDEDKVEMRTDVYKLIEKQHKERGQADGK